jgi:hypothetical protein
VNIHIVVIHEVVRLLREHDATAAVCLHFSALHHYLLFYYFLTLRRSTGHIHVYPREHVTTYPDSHGQ